MGLTNLYHDFYNVYQVFKQTPKVFSLDNL